MRLKIRGDRPSTWAESMTLWNRTAAVVTSRAARRVRRDWEQLCAATTGPVPFDPSRVVDLPEPARRYLTHTITAGTPLRQSVEVAMEGEIKLGMGAGRTAGSAVRGHLGTRTQKALSRACITPVNHSGGTSETDVSDMPPYDSTCRTHPDHSPTAPADRKSQASSQDAPDGDRSWAGPMKIKLRP